MFYIIYVLYIHVEYIKPYVFKYHLSTLLVYLSSSGIYYGMNIEVRFWLKTYEKYQFHNLAALRT